MRKVAESCLVCSPTRSGLISRTESFLPLGFEREGSIIPQPGGGFSQWVVRYEDVDVSAEHKYPLGMSMARLIEVIRSFTCTRGETELERTEKTEEPKFKLHDRVEVVDVIIDGGSLGYLRSPHSFAELTALCFKDSNLRGKRGTVLAAVPAYSSSDPRFAFIVKLDSLEKTAEFYPEELKLVKAENDVKELKFKKGDAVLVEGVVALDEDRDGDVVVTFDMRSDEQDEAYAHKSKITKKERKA